MKKFKLRNIILTFELDIAIVCTHLGVALWIREALLELRRFDAVFCIAAALGHTVEQKKIIQ